MTFKIVDRHGEFYTAMGTTNNGQHILFPVSERPDLGKFVGWMRTENFRFAPEACDDEHHETVVAIKAYRVEIARVEREIESLKAVVTSHEDRVAQLQRSLPAVVSPSMGTRMTRAECDALPREVRRHSVSATLVKLPKGETR